MALTKVIIVDCEYLFDECIEIILGSLKNIKISRLTSLEGDELDKKIAEIRPDVLIFDETRCTMDSAHIFRLLQSKLVGDRVILMDASGDVMEIYNHQRIRLKEISDFLKLFQREVAAS
jgi:chemotaxis response regulator CheB